MSKKKNKKKKKKQRLVQLGSGIPNPQSPGDIAAQEGIISQGSASAMLTLRAAQDALSHSVRMNMLAESQFAAVVQKLSTTDPVEAASIKSVVGNDGAEKVLGVLASLLGNK